MSGLSGTCNWSLVESMPFPVFIKDVQGRYLMCNRLFLEFFGARAEDWVGRTTEEASPPELAAAYISQDRLVLASRQPICYDGHVRLSDGQVREVRFQKSLLYNDHGDVEGIIGVFHDVTDERAAQRALAASEARFSRLAELSGEGVVLEVDGRVRDVNPAFCRMTGWPEEHLVGRPLAFVLTPDSANDIQANLGKTPVSMFRTLIFRQDGERFPVEIKSRETTVDGHNARVITVVSVAERQQAEQAMVEREMLYRQMFETNTAIKLLIEPSNGRIVDANHSAETFYGWSREQLRTMCISDINVLPVEAIRAEMERALSEARLSFVFPHRTASGEIRQVEVHSGPVIFHGRPLLHSIIHDVTERERAREELMRKTEALEVSNADLQQFAYVASHDLQEPLRTVVSYLQLLSRRYKGRLDAEADEFITFAVDGAKRMSNLIQDLLIYSRVDTKGHELEPTEMNGVAASTLANLHFLLEAMQAEVSVGELPTVMGDASQLASVFQNLIGNAVKYRDLARVPIIRIWAEPGEDGQWVFSVADNGIGIAEEYYERIFKIFQRLHTQTQYPGTGIGLALVRRIIARHGGRVWVESTPGQGSTFRFTLPAVVDDPMRRLA